MFDAYIRRAIEDGKPIFPKRFVLDGPDIFCPQYQDKIHLSPCICKKSLEQYEKETNSPWRWSCQMMNDPVAEDTLEFKRDYFRHFIFDEEHFNKLRNVKGLLCVDPAVSQKASADFTGFTVSKMTKDNLIYVPEAKQAKLTPDQVIDEIFRLVDTWNCDRVLIETVAAQILFVYQLKKEMLKRNIQFGIIPYKPPNNQTKETRIRSLIPFYAIGQIIHKKGLSDLEAQLVEFPRNRHDDIIDSLANHVPYWKDGGMAKVRPAMKEGTLSWWETKLPKNTSHHDKIFKGVNFKRRKF